MEGLLIMVVLFWLVPKLINAAKKKNTSGAKPAGSTAQRQAPSVQMHRPAPAMQRQAPSVKLSSHRDFSPPEAPCIVCEQTGEDHFARDKARRIAQLDEWLKNGIIDKNEYRVLKDRYQRGI